MVYRITADCVGCGACSKKCPWDAIFGEKKKKHVIDPTLCHECSTCWYTCPKCAVEDPDGIRRNGGKPRVPKANIDRERCVGCRNCLLNCDRRAIAYASSALVGRCTVDEAVCVGCASCTAYCPNGCIRVG